MKTLLADKNKLLIVLLGVVVLILLIVVLIVITLNRSKAPSVNNNGNNVENPTGNDDDDDDNGSTRSVVVKWWGAFLTSADVQPLIDAYEASNVNVDIQYTQQVFTSSELSSYKQRLKDSLAAGTGADVFMVDGGWVSAFADNLASAPSSIISSDNFEDSFHDFTSTALVKAGQVQGLPLWVDNLTFIYNKDMYEDAGLTAPSDNWNVFAEDQLPLLKKEDSSGRVTQTGFSAAVTANTEYWFDITNSLFLQNGVELLNSNGQAVFADEPASATAVNFYKSIATDQEWNDDYNLDVAAFLEKKVATIATSSWRLSDIIKFNASGNLGIDIGIAPLPQLSNQQKYNWGSYWANVAKKNNINNEEVWKFINFLSQEQQLQTLNQTLKQNKKTETGILYPRVDMTQTQLTDQYLAEFAKAMGYTVKVDWVDESLIKPEFAKIYTNGASLSSVQTAVNNILSEF